MTQPSRTSKSAAFVSCLSLAATLTRLFLTWQKRPLILSICWSGGKKQENLSRLSYFRILLVAWKWQLAGGSVHMASTVDGARILSLRSSWTATWVSLPENKEQCFVMLRGPDSQEWCL